MNRKEELRLIMANANAELQELEDREDEERNRVLVGQCFKYRNSYSLPKDVADYWYMYAKVLAASDSSLRMMRFQIDKYGKVEIEPETVAVLTEGYEKIPEAEFNAAWQAMMEKLEQL